MGNLKSLLGVDEKYLNTLVSSLEKYYTLYALVLPADAFFKGFQDLITHPYLKRLSLPSLTKEDYENDPFVQYWNFNIEEGREQIIKMYTIYFKASLYAKNDQMVSTLKTQLDFLLGQYNVPFELTLRYMLYFNVGQYWNTSVYDKQCPISWVSRFLTLLEDPEIKATIFSFELKSIDNTIEPYFRIGCTCCGVDTYVCYKKLDACRVICPNCLANLIVDKKTMEERTVSWFLDYINKYNSMNPAELTDEILKEVLHVVSLLKPIKLIRFGFQRSERIGHQLLNTGQYIDRKNRGIVPNSLDIIGYNLDKGIANEFLHSLWERYFSRTDDILSMKIGYILSVRLPVNNVHSLHGDLNPPGPLMVEGWKSFVDHDTQLFTFTADELRVGEQELIKMGVPSGAKYVCIHLRTSQYINDQKWVTKGVDFSYHDHRNADIENYNEAIQLLISKGYYVIRLGYHGQPSVSIKSPMFIDYANHYSTPFMDIFLSVYCDFMIGTASGIDGIPPVLKKKTLYTDVAEPLYIGMGTCCYWLPKNFYKVTPLGEAEISAFEIIRSGYRCTKKDLDMRSIVVKPNTPEQIVTVLKMFLEDFEEGRTLPISQEQKDIFSLQNGHFANIEVGHYFSPSEIKSYIDSNK